MKILITGANGLLGQKLIRRLQNQPGIICLAAGRGPNRLTFREGYQYFELDLTIEQQVYKILDTSRPDVIIHTAAMTNVDACETDQENCLKANVNTVQYLVKTLSDLSNPSYRPHLIHLSTDFIFDGTKGPLTEEETPNPLSYYAWSKLEAENIIRQSDIHWAIARTVLVYGITDNMSRSNIVLWVRDNLSKGKTISVVDDQFRTPTLAEDLAEGCYLIAEKKAQGIFNISGKDFMSILELAQKVAHHFQLSTNLILPSKSADIKQPAKRPPKTGFIIDKARTILGYNPHSFEEGLALLEQQINEQI